MPSLYLLSLVFLYLLALLRFHYLFPLSFSFSRQEYSKFAAAIGTLFLFTCQVFCLDDQLQPLPKKRNHDCQLSIGNWQQLATAMGSIMRVKAKLTTSSVVVVANFAEQRIAIAGGGGGGGTALAILHVAQYAMTEVHGTKALHAPL